MAKAYFVNGTPTNVKAVLNAAIRQRSIPSR